MTQTGGQHVHLVAAERGKNVTVMSCGNAVGSATPAVIQFK
jgi:hypothetical protein